MNVWLRVRAEWPLTYLWPSQVAGQLSSGRLLVHCSPSLLVPSLLVPLLPRWARVAKARRAHEAEGARRRAIHS